MSRAVLDTSILIAREQGRPLERPLPDQIAVSVVSIAELELGVLVGVDADTRAQRLRTLGEVRALAGALPIDERTAGLRRRRSRRTRLIHDLPPPRNPRSFSE